MDKVEVIALEARNHRSAEAEQKRQAALAAHVQLELTQYIRARLTGLLALLGLPIWSVALTPSWYPDSMRRCFLFAWALVAGGFVVFSVRELRDRLRRDELLAALRDGERS